MKYRDEYRDPDAVSGYVDALNSITTKPWTIMEICGGQTHAIVRYGIDRLLPELITLVHGPGCPVCVTPMEMVDRACEIAALPNVTFCSFGDMLRVPGAETDLLQVKARGGDVRIVYSPLDAVKLAAQLMDREVVFFAVGFETTAPANALAVHQAKLLGLKNFSVLVSHVLVPPAMEAILSSPSCRVQGFLAAGHVCSVMGTQEYVPLAERYKTPIVVTGFEPLDILQGLTMCVQQLENGRYEVENQYARVVRRDGNVVAQELMQKVFKVTERHWRGIGDIPQSGLGLSDAYADFDADTRFPAVADTVSKARELASLCISGEIMQGLKKPTDCPAFNRECSPEHPLGATMVSTEGACSAYYRYRRRG